MYLIIIPLLYAETLLVGLRSHFLILDPILAYWRLTMRFSVIHSSCKFLVEYLAVRFSFSAFTSSTAVSGPFGIALSLKCCPPPQGIIMYGCPNWTRTNKSRVRAEWFTISLWGNMAGVTGLEPVECRSQSPVPYQFGYTPMYKQIWKLYHSAEAHIYLYTAPHVDTYATWLRQDWSYGHPCGFWSRCADLNHHHALIRRAH